MDEHRFVAAVRAMGMATGRRQAIAGMVAALVAGRGIPSEARTARRKPAVEGPCGNGKRKANTCTRDSQCCTGLCNLAAGKKNRDGKGRCRCIRKGGACTADRNCCTGLTCEDGRCAAGSAPQCAADSDCTGATDACRNGRCTCGGAAACSGATPVCSAGVCVQCATNMDCRGIPGTICCGGACVTGTWQNQAVFGESGSDPDQFNGPNGVALSVDGLTILVADQSDKVKVWTRQDTASTTWAFQTAFGGSTEDDGIGGSNGVALSHDGLTAAVADTGQLRISVWRRSTATATDWQHQANFGSGPGSQPGDFANPLGVSLSRDGLIAAVVDSINNRISVWTRTTAAGTDWTHRTNFGSAGSGDAELDQPFGVAITGDGLTVMVVDQNNQRISVWTQSSANAMDWAHQYNFGSQGSDPDQFNYPTAISVTPDGLTAAVSEDTNNRVSTWGRETASSEAWQPLGVFASRGSDPDQLELPSGVSISTDGAMAAIADMNNYRVSVWAMICP